MLRPVPGDYLAAFGIRLMAVESFTDPAAHAGTVYEAGGHAEAGQTAGYGRSRGARAFLAVTGSRRPRTGCGSWCRAARRR